MEKSAHESQMKEIDQIDRANDVINEVVNRHIKTRSSPSDSGIYRPQT